MKVFMKRRNQSCDAVGEYNVDTKELIVKAGSVVSEKISDTKTFRGKARLGELRNMYVSQGKVKEDVRFTSPSTAANFVSGGSTNGLRTWKLSDGRSIKQYLEDLQKE